MFSVDIANETVHLGLRPRNVQWDLAPRHVGHVTYRKSRQLYDEVGSLPEPARPMWIASHLHVGCCSVCQCLYKSVDFPRCTPPKRLA